VPHAFGRRLTLGVEEELFLVDARTLDTVPAFTKLYPKPSERIKPELFECLLEITTPVCETAQQVLDELRDLRSVVRRHGADDGVAVLAAGTHPLARGPGQPLIPKQRYEKMAAQLGDAVYRQLVCGLHVHVGMPTPEACLKALAGVRPWLPELRALAANSPFVEGQDSGVESARTGRLAELPSAELPALDSWADWERATAGVDYTRLWWPVRPHPRHGTLEVRVCDQQTDVRRSAGFAGLVQALAAGALEPTGGAPQARGGLGPVVEEKARELGSWPLVEAVLARPPEAERQRHVACSGGLENVVRDLQVRTLE
jgi:carboxylate-amine ligase